MNGNCEGRNVPVEAYPTSDACGKPLDPIDRWVNELKREIVIDKVTNGFIVRIGCKTFVVVSLEELLADLELIYTDPKTVVKKYLPYLEATR